jgi:hypothetical protein
MRYLKWISGVFLMLVAILEYIDIKFPILLLWGRNMFEPAFLEMIYKIALVVLLIGGFTGLERVVAWWLKGKDKQINAWIHERNDTFGAILDEHLKRANNHLKVYRETYEKRLDKIEENIKEHYKNHELNR